MERGGQDEAKGEGDTGGRRKGEEQTKQQLLENGIYRAEDSCHWSDSRRAGARDGCPAAYEETVLSVKK